MAGVAMSLPEFVADAKAAAGRVAASVAALLRKFAVAATADLKQNMNAGVSPDGTPYKPLRFPRPRGGTLPLRDTGRLQGSIGAGPGHVERYQGDRVVVGTNLGYAAIHQYGGTIVPRRGKFLAIPATVEAQRASSPLRFGGKLSPRIGPRGGVLLSGVAGGKGGVVQFYLAKMVRVAARPFVGVSRKLRDTLARIAGDNGVTAIVGGR